MLLRYVCYNYWRTAQEGHVVGYANWRTAQEGHVVGLHEVCYNYWRTAQEGYVVGYAITILEDCTGGVCWTA